MCNKCDSLKYATKEKARDAMKEFNAEEAEAMTKFAVDFFKEAAEVKKQELGRDLTVEELTELRDAVLLKFFGKEEE